MMKKVALHSFPLFLIGAVMLLTGVLYACQKASDEAKQQLVLLVDHLGKFDPPNTGGM